MACLVRRNKDGKVVSVFNKKGENITNQLFNTVAGRLKQTGLAKDVVVLSNDELQKKLSDIQQKIVETKGANVKFSTFDDELQNIKEQAIADGSFMKAPNGQPTNLNEKQWLQVRTTRFKEWFGDWENDTKNASKVVDENGEPLVVYHGGTVKNVFDKDKNGTGGGRESAFFFTPDIRQARDYAGENEVKSVFLNIKNPEITDVQLDPQEVTDIIEKGKDGYWLLDEDILINESEIAVFNPNQIKSATDNIGSFSQFNDDIRYSKENQDAEFNFEKWKGDNELVEGDEISNIKTGQPVVMKVYHGTTHEFYEFDAENNGQYEGHLGKVNYFTSDESDSEGNYTSGGQDLQIKIMSYADRIINDLEEEYVDEDGINYDFISEDYNISKEEIEGKDLDEISKLIAEKKYKGGGDIVLELYVKSDNPLVIGNNEYIEVVDRSEYESEIETAEQEMASEYDITVEEAREDYAYEIEQRAKEIAGVDTRLADALQKAIDKYSYEQLNAYDILGYFTYDDVIDIDKLDEHLRSNDDILFAEDNYGNLTGTQIIAEFYKNLGYDSVVLTDVSNRFRNMGLSRNTSHIHVFDEFKNNIKLADGSNMTFNPNTADIRFSKRSLSPTQVKHKRLLNRLKRSFPNVKILNEQEYQQKLRDEAGVELSNNTVVYGVKFSDGSIYLNDKFLDLETPIHEFSHIWEAIYPEKWTKLLDEFRDTQGFKQALKEIQENDLYKNLPLKAQESEALNTLIGRKGATYFKGNTLQRFLERIKDFLRSVLHKLGVLHLSKEDLFEINVNRVVRDIVGGKPKVIKNGVVTNMDKVYESLYNLIPNVEYAESRALPLGQQVQFSGKIDSKYETSDFYNKVVKELFGNKSFDELTKEEKWDIAFLKNTGINPKKFKNAEELHFFVESEVNRLEKEVEKGKYIMQEFTSADAQALYESYLKTGNADAGMMREAINDDRIRKELLKQTQDNQRNSFKAQLNHFRQDGLPVGLQYILLNEILRKDFRVESDITIDGRTGKLSSYVKYLKSQGKTETEIENLIEQYNAEGKITKKYVTYKRKPNTINTFFEVDFGAVSDIIEEGYLYRNVIGKVNDIDLKNVGSKVDLTRFGKYKVKELSNGYVLYKFPKGDENAIPLIQAYSSATKQLMDSMPWCTNGDSKARSVIENGDVFVVLTQTGEPRIQVTYNSDGSIEELGGIGANQSVRVQDSPLIDEIKEFIPNIESEQNRIKRDQLLYQLKIGNKISKEDFKWLLEKADRSSTYEDVTEEYQEFLDNLDRETVAEYYDTTPDKVVIGGINILEDDEFDELRKIKDVEIVIGNVDIWFQGSSTLSLKKVFGDIVVNGDNGGTLDLNQLETVKRLQIYSFDKINFNKLKSVYEISMNGVSTEVNAPSLETIEYQLYSEYKNKLNAGKLKEVSYISLYHQSKINSPSLLKVKTLNIYRDSRISTEQLKSVDYLTLNGKIFLDFSNLEYAKDIYIKFGKNVIFGDKLTEINNLKISDYNGVLHHNINKIKGWLKLHDSNFENLPNIFDKIIVGNGVEIGNTQIKLNKIENLKYLTLFSDAKLHGNNLKTIENLYVYDNNVEIDLPKLNNVKELVFDKQGNLYEADFNLQFNDLKVDTLLLSKVVTVTLKGVKSIQKLRKLSSYKTLIIHDTTYIGEMMLEGGILVSNGLESIGHLEVGLFSKINAPKLSEIHDFYLSTHSQSKFIVSDNLPQRIKDTLITNSDSVEFVKDNNIKNQKSRYNEFYEPLIPDLESLKKLALPEISTLKTIDDVADYNARIYILNELYNNGMLAEDYAYDIDDDYVLELIGEHRTFDEIVEENKQELEDYGFDENNILDFVDESDLPDIMSIEDMAVHAKGITENINEAGYILQDGRLLDFSGKRVGGMYGQRSEDHRQLGIPVKEDTSPYETMKRFMATTGAIRIDGTNGMIDIATKPTESQKEIIKQILKSGNGWYIDVANENKKVGIQGKSIEHALYLIDKFYENDTDFSDNQRISFQQSGVKILPNGFVYDGVVYLNKDLMTLDTPIHEFGHLWIDFIKENNNTLYQQGIELVKKEGQFYINKVLETQPELEGNALYEEALAEMIGDSGANIVAENIGWLEKFWNFVKKMFGISKTTDISNMTLAEFTDAIAKELLSGQEIGQTEISKDVVNFQKVKVESQTFDTIATTPNVDSETALEVYKNVFSQEFISKFGDWVNSNNVKGILDEGGEPKVFYRTSDNTVFDNYEDALKHSQGGIISVGFISSDDLIEVDNEEFFNTANNDTVVFGNKVKINNNGDFISVLDISASTNTNTVEGFVNNSIKNGKLSGKKVLVDDNYYYKAKGELQSLSKFNAQLVLEDFYNYSIKDTHQIKEYLDGLLQIDEKELKDNEVLLIDENGISKKITDEELWNEIQQGKFEEYKKKYSGFLSIFYKLWRKFNNIYKGSIKNEKRVLSGEDLRLKLLNILNDLGVSTITISEYIEKYNKRQGQDPDIKALADISNKLIAYANGEISIEDLTEETVHFIIEALGNKFGIDNLLDEVVHTDAWNKYSQQYYNKYMAFYSGTELYNIVRKEVLGKIIKENIISKVGQETNKSIIVKIKQLIEKFFDIIRGRYNDNVKSKFNDTINEITDRILNDEMSELLDSNRLSDSSFVMYSLNEKRSLASILKFKQSLEKRLQQLKRSKDAYSGKLQNDLARLSDAINQQDEWYAIKSIVASVEPQVKQINTVLAQYREKTKQGITTGTYFSQDEKRAFTVIKNDYLPLLQELRAIISTYEENDIPENIDKGKELARLDDVINLITQVEGYDSIQAKEDVKSILKSIVSYYQLTTEEEELLEKEIEKEFKDISWFQANFGSLEHSNNIFLNLLGRIITDGNNRAHLKSLRDISPFLKKIEKMGLKIDDFRDLLEQDENGKHTKYFLSPWKFYKFEQEELKAKVDAYNKVFGKNFTVEQYKDAKKKGYIKSKSDFTYEELKEYNSIMSDWYDENTERRYTKEFYEQRKQMYEQLGISEETKTFLQSLSTRRYFIMKKYLKNGKSLDYSELTEYDLQQLLALSQERKTVKSLIDSETGLEKEGVDKTIAEDLKKLDEYYQEQNKGKENKIKQQFFDTLKQIELTKGSKEAFKWLQLNGGIIFNDKFWEQFDNGKKNYIDLLRDGIEVLKETDEDMANELEPYIDEIEDLMKRKREVLKQYQMPNNPSEINFDLMSTNTIENIKNIEQRLNDLFKKVSHVTGLLEIDKNVGEEVSTENTLNEAYYKALKDSGKGELEFLKEHMLDSDRVYLEELLLRLNKIRNGSNYIDSRFKKYLEKQFGITDISADQVREIIDRVGVEQIVISYGNSKVMPYFKRFAPNGYENFMNDISEGKISVYNTVRNIVSGTGTGIEQYLGINTYFSWLDDTNGNDKYINPNYNENFEGGLRQPKLSKYANDTFFDKFGIDKNEFFRTGELKPTINIEMFNILNDMLDIKRKALEAYNEEGSENLYKVPQVSKGIYERLKDSFSGGVGTTISNTVKDIFYNRVDELAYGEKFDGKDIIDDDTKVIPKYYLRDLEEDSDVATELPHTLAMLLHSAYTYEERLNTVTDVMRLEQKLLDSKFVGKRAESTRAYKMFKDFVDGYFYGKQISKKFTLNVLGKEVDISRLAIVFDRFVRTMNIGFSLPIALTAYTTEKIFLKIEEVIGEHVNSNSAKWASREWKKLTPGYLNDVAKIHKENKLYQLMEKFRLHEIDKRTKSAGFNRIARAFNDVAYKFLEATNYPNLARVLLTVLDDYRLVDGKIMSYNEFRKSNPDFIGKSNKEITEIWNNYRDKSVYNIMESVDGRMEWKQEYIDRLGEEYLEGQYQRIQSKVMRVNSNVDAVVPQEDKSAATRDYLMNFMTAHRGWLAIAVQRKFKGRHFNFQTGQYEEGHYITFGKYLQKLLDFKNGKTFTNLFSTIKEEYNKLDEMEQQNVRRVMVEFGVYMLLLGLGVIVAGLVDDDKNKDLWALQFASYIYFRTTSEVGSVQAPTGVVGLIDVAQSPFIALNSIKNILKVSDYSFEPVKQGAYKGHSKFYRKIMKLWWARHYYKLADIKKTSDYYRLLNAETLITMQRKKKDKDN